MFWDLTVEIASQSLDLIGGEKDREWAQNCPGKPTKTKCPPMDQSNSPSSPNNISLANLPLFLSMWNLSQSKLHITKISIINFHNTLHNFALSNHHQN